MSYIAMMEGELHYATDEAFETAREFLQEHGFQEMVELDAENRDIIFPYKTYRNLGRNLDPLLNTATSGKVIGTSNETSWHGIIATPGENREIDLNEWAEENGFTDPPDPDENWDAYTDWQSRVESHFFTEHPV